MSYLRHFCFWPFWALHPPEPHTSSFFFFLLKGTARLRYHSWVPTLLSSSSFLIKSCRDLHRCVYQGPLLEKRKASKDAREISRVREGLWRQKNGNFQPWADWDLRRRGMRKEKRSRWMVINRQFENGPYALGQRTLFTFLYILRLSRAWFLHKKNEDRHTLQKNNCCLALLSKC